ncbi:28S ribosomal protein S31, mitochondrial-like, partial [Mus caroli]|uniref:Small ribosomal subunit protein mS31 n=1 Tax=Mus caroli TaxID=10089 RepID=A0A6P7R5V3_MUSCR
RPRPFSGLPLSCGNRDVSVAVLPAAQSGAVRFRFVFFFRNEFLSPELVAAASAVADSLPFDKQTTKSELLRQLQQHEEESRAQKDREKRRIRSMSQKGSSVAWGPFHLGRRMFVLHKIPSWANKMAQNSGPLAQGQHSHSELGPPTKCTELCPLANQLQVLESSVVSDPQQRLAGHEVHVTSALRMGKWSGEDRVWDNHSGDLDVFFKCFYLRKYLFKGKRLSVFDVKAFADEAPEPGLLRGEQPFSKERSTLSFRKGPGALAVYFPKQGPIRLFMELVTCGLSKNPYLSVKQKVEHIEWFRNYFNEKRDILKENNIAIT